MLSFAFAPKTCATRAEEAPAEVEVAPPVPSPLASDTTPPTWSPPENGGGAAPLTTASVPVVPQAPSAELLKARAAADAKDFKKVRTLLEKKVRSGKPTPEELQLVHRACVQLKDKGCADAVKAKHPADITE